MNKIINENFFSFLRINDLNIYEFSLRFSLKLLANHQERKISSIVFLKTVSLTLTGCLLTIYSRLRCPLRWPPSLSGEQPQPPSDYAAQAPHRRGLSGHGAGALLPGFQDWHRAGPAAGAQGHWDAGSVAGRTRVTAPRAYGIFPDQGPDPRHLPLAGGFLTTPPPGESFARCVFPPVQFRFLLLGVFFPSCFSFSS